MEFLIAAGIFVGLGTIAVAVVAVFRIVVKNNQTDDIGKPK